MSIYPSLPECPIPSRVKYSSSKFVGREEKIERFSNKIDEAQRGLPITRPVVHLWGVPGIGKTWLLQHIYHEYSFNHPQYDVKARKTLPLLVDFAKIEAPMQGVEVGIEFLSFVIRETKSCLQGKNLSQCSPAWTDLITITVDVKKNIIDTTSFERFVTGLKGLSTEFILLILFDSVENLSSEAFFWLETNLLKPLAVTDHVVIVVAGRREIHEWKEVNVRRRLEPRALDPLDLAGTREQGRRRNLSDVFSDHIHRLTSGFPYANQVLMDALENEIRSQLSDEKRVSSLGVVEKKLFDTLKVEGDRDVLRTLSALRKFNIESARRLLAGIIDECYRTISNGDCLRLFERLEQSSLVRWDTDKKGYVVPIIVRRVLQQRLQLATPEKYRELHEYALEMYEDWIHTYPNECGEFLPEIIYHYAQIYHCAQNQKDLRLLAKLEVNFNTSLSEALELPSFGLEEIDELQRAFEEDEELRLDLPQDLYERVQIKLQERKEDLS